MSLLTDELLAIWKRAYRAFPRATSITTIIFLVLGLFGVIISIREDKKRTHELERKRAENLSYTQQLDSLNSVQGSLNNLIAFVEMQKTKLKESEDLVNTLRTEQEKLKPVVEADRKTVDALLDLQAQRTEQSASRERWYGFGLGVVSSLVASL